MGCYGLMMNMRYLALFLLGLMFACADPSHENGQTAAAGYLMFVGTYTKETSKGIQAYRFDPATGTATDLGLVAEMREPSFLALHPSNKYLYALSEIDDYDAAKSGSITAFSIDTADGKLTKLNEVSSRGAWPCHLNVNSSGSMLIVANYAGGSIASFPVNDDGTLGEAVSFFQHEGSSVHPRQDQPHAHSADFAPDGRFAFFSDLGLDQVKVYEVNPEDASLQPNDPSFVSVASGSGPRHFAFHPSGRFAYGINEIGSTVSTYSFDSIGGELIELQAISTLPDGFDGESYTAEIYVHPSGKFVYGTNRGHNSMAVFSVDEETGALTTVEQVSTGGEWPRNFAIDPTGEFLLAANQNTDNIVIFRIDNESGRLTATGEQLSLDAPVCIRFLVP